MTAEDDVLEAVGLIYDAAIDPGLWPKALESLSARLRSSAATLLFGDPTSAAATILESTGIDRDSLTRYSEYYAQQDVRLLVALPRPGGIMTNARLPEARDLYRGEFYSDLLCPADLPYLIGSILLKEDGAFSSLGIRRSRRSGEFTREEERLYLTFVPHLQRAIGIHRRLHRARLQTSAGADALDRLAIGVLLLGEQGRPLLVNRSAQEILDHRDGLTLQRDGLHAARVELTNALRELIRQAGRTGHGQGLDSGGVMALPRPSLLRPLSVLVAPLRLPHQALLPLGTVVAVFVSDPEQVPEASPELLQRLYGLTAAESRLATLLLEGKSVEEAAGALEISTLTARTQLKAVFQKTGANRQSELIRVLMTAVGQLRRTTGALR